MLHTPVSSRDAMQSHKFVLRYSDRSCGSDRTRKRQVRRSIDPAENDVPGDSVYLLLSFQLNRHFLMATDVPDTPHSTKSIYFDAPLAHFSDDPDDNMMTPAGHPPEPNVAQNPSVANTPIVRDKSGGTTSMAGASHNGNIAEEMDAPEYAPPGPDDKLSRSYLPVNSKPLARSTKRKADVAAESTLPEHAASTTSQSEVVRSPTSGSIGSGGGHRRGEGSTFANGAAVTGPNSHPEVDESVHDRAAAAETVLPAKTKSKLSKAERELYSFYLGCDTDDICQQEKIANVFPKSSDLNPKPKSKLSLQRQRSSPNSSPNNPRLSNARPKRTPHTPRLLRCTIRLRASTCCSRQSTKKISLIWRIWRRRWRMRGRMLEISAIG